MSRVRNQYGQPMAARELSHDFLLTANLSLTPFLCRQLLLQVRTLRSGVSMASRCLHPIADQDSVGSNQYQQRVTCRRCGKILLEVYINEIAQPLLDRSVATIMSRRLSSELQIQQITSCADSYEQLVKSQRSVRRWHKLMVLFLVLRPSRGSSPSALA